MALSRLPRNDKFASLFSDFFEDRALGTDMGHWRSTAGRPNTGYDPRNNRTGGYIGGWGAQRAYASGEGRLAVMASSVKTWAYD